MSSGATTTEFWTFGVAETVGLLLDRSWTLCTRLDGGKWHPQVTASNLWKENKESSSYAFNVRDPNDTWLWLGIRASMGTSTGLTPVIFLQDGLHVNPLFIHHSMFSSDVTSASTQLHVFLRALLLCLPLLLRPPLWSHLFFCIFSPNCSMPS